MVILEVLLILWLVGGTALHIYSLKIAKESDNYGEESVSEICRKNGIPIVFGAVFSYLVSLIIGVPFVMYKLAVLVITNRRKEE